MARDISREHLDLFWTLTEGNEVERITATTKLVSWLKSNQGEEKIWCKELDYSVTRLIKGLSSNRKWARLGFSMALTQIFRNLPAIKTGKVLEIMTVQLKYQHSDSKAQKSGIVLGKVLTLLAMIQSGIVKKAKGKHLEIIVHELQTISSSKAPLHLLCTQALGEVILQITSADFQEHVRPKLEKQLTIGWDQCQPDDLLLLLVVVRHHKKVLEKKFLVSHWGTKSIISKEKFSSIGTIIVRSAIDLPVLHPVIKEIIQSSSEENLLPEIWSKVFDGQLIKMTKAKQQICLSVVPDALNLVSSDKVEVILSKNVVQCAVQGLQRKQDELNGMATLMMQRIMKEFSTKSADFKIAVLKCLFKNHGNLEFDAYTRTKTIGSLTNMLCINAMREWLHILKELVLTKSFFGMEQTMNEEATCHWVVANVNHIINSTSMTADPTLQSDILQFLFVHSHFDIVKPTEEIPQCSELPEEALSSQCRTILQDGFSSSLNKLSTFRVERAEQSKGPQRYINLLYDHWQFIKILLDNSSYVVPLKTFETQTLDQFQKMMKTIEKIRNKSPEDSVMDGSQAFMLLFIHIGLQLFTQTTQATEALADMQVCYEKVFQKRRRSTLKKPNDDEPEWIEVVTELLLSFLSQEQHLLRVVVNNAFKIFAPHLTQKALALILATLEPESKEDDEDDPLEFENDSDDEDGSDEEKEDEDNESDSEDDDESDAEQDKGEINAELFSAVKTALGKAALEDGDDEDDGDDDDEISDIDDETMLQMDKKLAQVFKTLSKDKKAEAQKATQIRHFQLRCLDLVATITSNKPNASLVLPIVNTLLSLMNAAERDSKLTEQAERASGIFNRLVKVKKFSIDAEFEPHILIESTKELLTYSSKVAGVPIIFRLANALEVCVSLAVCSVEHSAPSPVKTRAQRAGKPGKKKDELDVLAQVSAIIEQGLSDFCEKRDSHLSHLLFHKLLSRKPVELWSLADPLLQFTLNSDIRIFCRTQACAILAAMINKHNVNGIGADRWNVIKEKIIQEIPKVLAERQCEETFKQRNVHDMLLLLSHTLQVMGKKDEAVPSLKETLGGTVMNCGLVSTKRQGRFVTVFCSL